jgi:arabinofuranosyltransferase
MNLRRLSLPRSLVLVLLATALWDAWFIFRTSFEAGGRRIFCLFDDAMISMTYARNLVEGHGLNWARQSAPVEGFSHPLWTFLMVPINALPLDLRVRSLGVQLISLVLLLVHVALVWHLVRRFYSTATARFALPAAALTAAFYPLNYWSLMGMETALQALLATGAVFLALEIVEEGRDRHLALWGLAAFAYLLRMDLLLLFAGIQLWVLASGGLRRGQRGRWLAGSLLPLAAVVGYGIFRWIYFHDLLPNTYYLKLTGIPLEIRWLRGLATQLEFWRIHLLWLLPVLAGGFVIAAVNRRWRGRLLLAALPFLLYAAYCVYIGGDVWEIPAENVRANRFLAFGIPLLFVLGNGILNLGVDALLRRFPRAWSGDLPPRLLAAAVTITTLLLSNGLWLSDRTPDNWRALVVTDRPMLVVNHQLVYQGVRRLQTILLPDAVVAVFWAGIPAYFSDFRMVDLLGYNDRHIARGKAAFPYTVNEFQRYVPGHAKWDNDYVFREHRPDAMSQIWGIPPDRVAPTLRRHGYRRREGFWVKWPSDKLRPVTISDPEAQ